MGIFIFLFFWVFNGSSGAGAAALDTRNGVFYWQPGPGFIGAYRFVFVDGRDGKKKFVTLNVRLKSFLQR